ncbi:MAG TPA: thiamine pyrophosphate-dependent enzyme [Candidatus Hydrogenedentes bacterium]|nr:thiamine pyrophosphate-dependent enzyme [Candidatus Hydrogenedentota bacterium]HPG69909.1 thiamine pyrophosphate-dependent enzyme [Candidatus Hydrogenedentota bacterium]
MSDKERLLLSGNEAVALAALHARVALATAYPGTPSTEILENLAKLGGKAQWCPNEKVAFEVALGAAFGGARALVTMKHVGVNVAADPLFTAMHTGVSGSLVLVSADDPGMWSSQNEQDNRNYSKAAGVPTFEPSDSQEAYDLLIEAVEFSEKWKLPVMLRMTTRICHSKSIVKPHPPEGPFPTPHFERDIPARTMLPGFARPAHRRLRKKLDEIYAWNETSHLAKRFDGDKSLGIITSGVCFNHAREAAPEASILKLSMVYPLPIETMRAFAESVDRCVVIEEGDAYLADAARAAGIVVESKDTMYRFGELNVGRVRRILAGDNSEEPVVPKGKPPQLCATCPHRAVFASLAKLGCYAMGDIGCYTLGALPPYQSLDSCVCMGASIGLGLGLRHVLPPEEAKRMVSVIGDSTFVHGGITGLVEMAYNRPSTGHVVLILDNSTTAMTGLQEHPGTGRTLDHRPTHKLDFAELAKAIGIERVYEIDPMENVSKFQALVKECLELEELVVIIARRTCSLAEKKIAAWERAAAEKSHE